MEPLDKKAKSVKACETCKKPFGLTRIRHTCKRCHKIICADCTKDRIKIVTYDLKNAHKVCIACEKEHNFQNKFATTYQTSWNTLSKLGAKWLEITKAKIILSNIESESEETYQNYLEIAKNANSHNPKFQLIDNEISQGKVDREVTNYSLQGFLYYNQGNLKVEQIRTSIANVLKAFFIKFPSVEYSHSMNFLCMFLLTVMDEESAFWMLGYIVTQILPKDFYGGSATGLQQEKFILNSLIKEKLGLNQDLAGKVASIIDNSAHVLLSTLLVNSTNFEVSFEAWNMMITNQNVNEIRKVVIQIFKTLLPKIQESPSISVLEFKLMVIRLFNSEEFKGSQNIGINDKEIELLEEKFRNEFSTQSSLEIKTSNASTEGLRFTKEQIMGLYQEFSKLQTPIVGKEQFKKITAEVLFGSIEGKELLQVLDLDQLYDTFDTNKDEGLIYEEFLFLASMIMNESLDNKVQTAWNITDSEHKGFLTNDQFNRFIQVLIQTSAKFTSSNTFYDEIGVFKDTLSNATKDKEAIYFNDVVNQLLNNDFSKYYDNLSNSKPIDSHHKTNYHQKEHMTDVSLVHNNQTIMDSTQDVSHNLHSNRDLTRLLDHSNEQSTITEVEGSKYEEDQSRTEDLLTEEQKEKILGLDHENNAHEEHKEETKKEETKIPIVKPQEDSESDSEEQMRLMMQKLKSSPKKATQTPITTDGLAVNKVENTPNFEQVFDNFVAKEDNENADAIVNTFEVIFDATKEDKALNAHSIQIISQPISHPFARNTLTPAKTEEIDIKPSYLGINFFEKIEKTHQAHAPLNSHANVKKPMFSSDLLQVLTADHQSHNIQSEEWKESFFETTQTLIEASNIVNKSCVIQKPFLNNPCFTPSPEQEQEQQEVPNLHFWRPDEIDHGDIPLKPTSLVIPSRVIPKCVPQLPNITEYQELAPLKNINVVDSQPTFTAELELFSKENTTARINEVANALLPLKKPLAGAQCYPLNQETCNKRDSIFEAQIFECVNKPSIENKPTYPLVNLKQPLVKESKEDTLLPLARDEIKDSSNFLWKENCFDINDTKINEMSSVYAVETGHNAFGKEICHTLSPYRRNSEVPVIDGWKEECFNLTDKATKELDVCEADSVSKGLLTQKTEESLLSHNECDISKPVVWNNEIFNCIDTPHKASLPSVKLSMSVKPIQKQTLSHSIPQEHIQIDNKSELRIFGSVSKPELNHTSSCLSTQVPKLRKMTFENVAQSLKVDEGDGQLVHIDYSIKYDQVQVQSHECATTSKNVDKVEEHLYDNILAPLAQDKQDDSLDSNRLENFLGLFNKIEAPLKAAHEIVVNQIEEENEREFEEVKEEIQWHEREQEIQFKAPEVMEECVLEGKVLEKKTAQAKEPAEGTSLKTNTEDIDRKQQLIYDEEDEELDPNSTFINASAIGENTSPGIYNTIVENGDDPQIASKRKENAKQEAKEHKDEACKTCNVF